MIIPVILSGGSGSRLWPLSRDARPKQFLPIIGKSSLFQDTLRRLEAFHDLLPPIVICNEEHRFLVAEQLRDTGFESSSILLEPEGRNTAPAIACVALHAADQGFGDELLLVMPSDHAIENAVVFRQAVDAGVIAAEQGSLVTFGVVPQYAETGFGYIKRGDAGSIEGVFPIDKFVEKPDSCAAENYLQSGDFFWNSGIFLFRASVFLDQLNRHRSDILDRCRAAVSSGVSDLDFFRLDRDQFLQCSSDSIDYAVMERTSRGMVVPFDGGWSDLGSWLALWGTEEKDGHGNVCVGDVVSLDTQDCYLRGDHRLVAAVGLEGVVVVETPDAVLVASKEKVQDVKQLVSSLKANNRCEHMYHVRVFRPWGSYETVEEGERFKVKRIVVKPGESLSLQMHHHRAEHWVVVKGTATVTKGDEVLTVTEDQSVYIPVGMVHRLANPGRIPLEIIEVQTGSYLGEDDIVRFGDNYGR